MSRIDDKITDNFRRREFLCKHCKLSDYTSEEDYLKQADGIDPRLVQALQKLRTRIGSPISVTSGYRCSRHPETIKRPGSQHAKGLAADIRVNGMTPRQLLKQAQMVPEFHGLGVDDDEGYVHVDIRDTIKLALWSYKDGKPVPFFEVAA